MAKYGQDKDKQLQRFRNACQKVRGGHTKIIESAWNILDTEFIGLLRYFSSPHENMWCICFQLAVSFFLFSLHFEIRHLQLYKAIHQVNIFFFKTFIQLKCLFLFCVQYSNLQG